MLFGDEDEAGENPAEPSSDPVAERSAGVGIAFPSNNLPPPSFTRSPIEAWWLNGPSSGESDGAGAPMRWKKAGCPGAMRKRRPSSRSGINSVTNRPRARLIRCPRLTPSETNSGSLPSAGAG